MSKVSMTDFEEACELYIGWCSRCKEFTRECTEPDAHDYDCPSCGQLTVTGAEDAMMEGLFKLGG